MAQRRTALSVLPAALLGLLLPLLTAAGAPSNASPPDDGTTQQRAALPPEVWQRAQLPYPQNRSNPLAKRRWGVYKGSMEMAWKPYQQATGDRKRLLGKIALRPKASWIGRWTASPRELVPMMRNHIRQASGGNRNVLVQLTVYRMKPWGAEGCDRAPTLAEREEYRNWIRALARAIGRQHTAIILQPDLPLLGCVPKRQVSKNLIRFAAVTLSNLPNTSVYLDAGAADWSSSPQNQRPSPEQIANHLMGSGIKHVRGFALNSTHYTGVVDDVRWGARIVSVLHKRGQGRKHFVVDTAKNGVPMRWGQVIPSAPGEIKNNARVCKTKAMRRCVTMGIPPTVQTAHVRWKLPADVRMKARRHVDAYMWFGRPWLYNQAAPFKMQRAIPMARTTPWPGPPV